VYPGRALDREGGPARCRVSRSRGAISRDR